MPSHTLPLAHAHPAALLLERALSTQLAPPPSARAFPLLCVILTPCFCVLCAVVASGVIVVPCASLPPSHPELYRDRLSWSDGPSSLLLGYHSFHIYHLQICGVDMFQNLTSSVTTASRHTHWGPGRAAMGTLMLSSRSSGLLLLGLIRWCPPLLTSLCVRLLLVCVLHPSFFPRHSAVPASSSWHVLVDTGSSCLGLPAEFYDMVISWLPLRCNLGRYDSLPNVCYISDDVRPVLPTLSFKLADVRAAPSTWPADHSGRCVCRQVESGENLSALRCSFLLLDWTHRFFCFVFVFSFVVVLFSSPPSSSAQNGRELFIDLSKLLYEQKTLTRFV